MYIIVLNNNNYINISSESYKSIIETLKKNPEPEYILCNECFVRFKLIDLIVKQMPEQQVETEQINENANL